MNLADIFDLDPTVKRKILYATIMVFVLIAVGLIPVVIQTNFFQNSSGAEQGFVPATVTATKTQTLMPLPDSQTFVLSGEIEPVVTPVQRNCTYSTAYWLEHRDSWPALISIGDFNYTKEQAGAHIQNDMQSSWGNLFLNLHTTLLNLLSGSDPGEIKLTITDAISWLNAFTNNDTITELDLQIGQILAQKLFDYNHGEIGPGLCEADLELSDKGTLTAVFSQPTGTISLTPSRTATLTSTSSGIATLPKHTPTLTQIPNQEDEEPPPPPTKQPSATATQPPPPTATATKPPPPPTDTPKPTDPPPPPTDTPPPPTEQPTPTSPPP